MKIKNDYSGVTKTLTESINLLAEAEDRGWLHHKITVIKDCFAEDGNIVTILE